MPLDAIGYIYSDWITSSAPLPPLINVVHPLPTTWDVVFHGICEELGAKLPIISLDQWVAKLDDIAARASKKDVADIVRTTRLSFYEILTLFLAAGTQSTRLLPSFGVLQRSIHGCAQCDVRYNALNRFGCHRPRIATSF